MAIRLSGLTSGMDTDAIVQELVSAYSLKTEKYEKASTKLTWKQDIWKSLNTKIYSLYTNVSNLRFSSAYSLRTTSVSDATKATVTASSTAVTGTQTLNILKTAQASYMTGGQLGSSITADSKLSDLGYKKGNTEITLKAADGTKTAINITKDTTITEVVNQFKEAGYNASFDATNKRIFISAKESGAASNFDLVGDDENAKAALSALGLNAAMVEVDADGNKTLTGAAGDCADAYNNYYLAALNDESGNYLNEDGSVNVKQYIEDQIAAYNQLKADAKSQQYTVNDARLDVNTISSEIEQLEQHKVARNAHDALTSQLEEYGLTSDEVKNLVEKLEINDDGNYSEESIKNVMTELGIEVSDENLSGITEVVNGNKENISKIQAYTSEHSDFLTLETEKIEKKIAEKEEKLATAKTTVEEAEYALANINEKIDSHLMKDLVEDNTVDDADKTDENIAAAINGILSKVDEAINILNDEASTKGSAVKIDGQDAEIQLNGVTYTNSTNSFTINGLTINAQAVTGRGIDNAIQITTSIDTQGVYDKVKDFLTEYNNVINEMCKLYNADSASDYEPLTDEEKEAMSDEQIEKWETKIKDSLLRRDTTLNSIMSAMINSMSQTIEINGTKLSLSTFGIQTLGFLNAPENENYAYHIDGDEDDENTSGNDDKLMAAIMENPEQVQEFMKQLAANLYTAIDNKMKSTELSSAYKVYNDKEMDSELEKYEDAISKWEEKVTDKEDYYYNKFSQMEVALSKLQSQTSSLSGLLGY